MKYEIVVPAVTPVKIYDATAPLPPFPPRAPPTPPPPPPPPPIMVTIMVEVVAPFGIVETVFVGVVY
jgi:hypothetical protein